LEVPCPTTSAATSGRSANSGAPSAPPNRTAAWPDPADCSHVASASREASLRSIFEGRVSELTLKFLLLLNSKGRLTHLPAIIAAFDQRVQDALGRVEVDVYTAEPMDTEQRDSVGERIASKLGKQIALHTYVEPAMIGGIKIRIGDRLIDDSLATRLRRVRDRVARDGGAALRARAQRVIRDDS